MRAPALVSATWQFVLSLMKQKARERVTFVDSIEELARELGEGALTSDFGGSYEFDWDAWVQEKIEHEEQEEKRRALMALRRPLVELGRIKASEKGTALRYSPPWELSSDSNVGRFM